MITLQQELAQAVYSQVEAYLAHHPKNTQECQQYGSMAHRLPILVHSAGLVGALAFVDDRGKPPQKDLLDHLAIVLGYGSRHELMEDSRSKPFESYGFLTRKAIVALTWFKRFAQSVLEVTPDSEKDLENEE